MKDKQKIIDCLDKLADYYWQTTLYYNSKGDFLRENLYRQTADAYHYAATIVEEGPKEARTTTGEFSHLKYGEMRF